MKKYEGNTFIFDTDDTCYLEICVGRDRKLYYEVYMNYECLEFSDTSLLGFYEDNDMSDEEVDEKLTYFKFNNLLELFTNFAECRNQVLEG